MSTSIAHDLGKKERSLDVLNVGDDSLIDFRGLHLSEDVVLGLQKCGFHKPSPIQLRAIPAGRAHWDLLIKAKSGTGKTCVFSTLALEKTDMASQAIQVLILTPSREIAIQNKLVLKSIGQFKEGIEIRSFIGGIGLYRDCVKLCRTQIAVGTPGRICHLLREYSMDLSSVKLLVLDEADKLFEKGMFEDIQFIIKFIPKDKQIIAASATYPDGLDDFICRYMEAPHKIFMTDEDEDLVAPIAIAHYAVDIRKLVHVRKPKSKKTDENEPPKGLSTELIYQHKLKSLREIINQLPFEQCIIFLSSQLRAQRVYEDLKYAELDVVLLSGSMHQKDRIDSFRMLREGQCKMMVATELAGRGIDAESVDLVVNFDAATDLSEYIHRIGRAGRFGAPGTAITFLAYSGEWKKLSEFQLKTGITLSLIETMQELEQFSNVNFAPTLSKIIGENEGDGISAELREEFAKLAKILSAAPMEALNQATLFETLAINAYPDISASNDRFDSAMEEVVKLIELKKMEIAQDAAQAKEKEIMNRFS